MPASVHTAQIARSLRRGVCLGVLAACAGAAPAAAQQTVAIVLQVTGTTDPPYDRFAQIRVGAVVQVPATARLRFIYLLSCRDVDASGATLTFGAERYEVRGGEAAFQTRRTCPHIELLNSGEGALPAGSMVRNDQVPQPSGGGIGAEQSRRAPAAAAPPASPPPPPQAAPRPSPAAPPFAIMRPVPPDVAAAPPPPPGGPPASAPPAPDGAVRLTPEAPLRPTFILLGGYWRRVASAELRAGGQVVARWTVTSAELAWPASQPPLQDGALYTLVLDGAAATDTTSFSFRASQRLDDAVMLSPD